MAVKGRRKKAKRGRNVDAQVAALDRQVKALELRKAGYSYPTIASSLGYAGPSGAFKAVESALKATLREPANELRTLELARLDAMLVPLWTAVRAGNFGAIDRALHIMERRAKLLGLDRMTFSGLVDVDFTKLSDEQLQRLADGEDPFVVLLASQGGSGG